MQPWWKETTIYHIYPRSFLDTNGDGIGDLPGITQKLPYLRDLGIGAIWMGPVFRSPQVDNGYDISDYRDIDPLFGTPADMDALITTAHANGIRVLLDLVFNHTSDRHSWFTASRSDPGGEFGDYYIWRDAGTNGEPPNNWRSFFSTGAWTWSPERNQYYLHLFTPEQPDLNWEHEPVRRALSDTANFWLDRGVDGFRMDVINMISKRPGLPSLPGGVNTVTEHPWRGVYIDGPRVLEYLQEFRSRLHRADEIVLVGETPNVTPETARSYTDARNRALDMVLLFDHVALDHGVGGRWDPRPWQPREMREVIGRWQGALEEPSWPSLYLSNHDQPRVVSRYGDDGRYRYESATALMTAFFLQRGTPIIYQGDEIAMANFPMETAEDIVDIESGNAYRDLVAQGIDEGEAFRRIAGVARDNSRTPMQWTDGENAGFSPSGATPWYPVNPDHDEWNVAAQAAGDGTSVLRYVRELIALRHSNDELLCGGFDAIAVDRDSPVVAYRRSLESGESTVVVANLSAEPCPWTPGAYASDGEQPKCLFGNYVDHREAHHDLRPWECRVYQG